MAKLEKRFNQKKAKKGFLNGTAAPSYDEVDEYQHLKSSIGLVDDTLNMISSVKESMLHQQGMMDRLKQKTLKFINLTGFGQSIIRVITQRSKVDFVIFVVGAIVTLIVIFALWYFF